MSYILDAIEDIFTTASGQMLRSSLHHKATQGRPSLTGLVGWTFDGDPNGDLYRQEVSANSSVGTFPKGGPYNVPGRSVYVQARTILWGRYHFTVELTKSDEAQLMRANNQRKILNDFLLKQFISGSAAMWDKIETDAIGNSRISGGDANGLQGILDARSTSNTYLEINATTYALTGAEVLDNSGTPRPMTYALMQSLDTAITDTNGGFYDVILCSKAREKQIQDLNPALQNVPQQQSFSFANLEGRERAYSAGFTSTWFNGKPVLAIPGYTSTVLDYLDTSRLKGDILRMGVPERTVADDTVRWSFVTELKMWVENRDLGFASLIDLS
jgi:hypothetical protein